MSAIEVALRAVHDSDLVSARVRRPPRPAATIITVSPGVHINQSHERSCSIAKTAV